MNSWDGLRTGYLFSNWLPHIFQIAECILNSFTTSWGYRARSAHRWPCNSCEWMRKPQLQEFMSVVWINFASVAVSFYKRRLGSALFMEQRRGGSGSVLMWCSQGCFRQNKIRSPAPGRSNYIWAAINQWVRVCVEIVPLCVACVVCTWSILK